MNRYIDRTNNFSVALIARSTLYEVPGGDTVQIRQTAAHLRDMGVKATVKLTNEEIDYEAYTLLHFFNITRPADILIHIQKSKTPFVITPILINYSEYDKYIRGGFSGFLFRFLPRDTIEYCKTVARWLRGTDRLMSPSYLWMGQRRSIRTILKEASFILPNSNSEYMRVVKEYGFEAKHKIVPNGIDPALFKAMHHVKRDPTLIICVGRIEGIKNQWNLIRALNNTKYRLYLIGAAAPNQKEYYEQCKREAASNVHFIDHVPQYDLLYYYMNADIHVLPSWFETTGLSSLEAAAMGCKIVITDRGDTKDYFGDLAFYCDPGSPDSIYKAIQIASVSRANSKLSNKILKEYTWLEATFRTIEAYKSVTANYGATNWNLRYSWNT